MTKTIVERAPFGPKPCPRCPGTITTIFRERDYHVDGPHRRQYGEAFGELVDKRHRHSAPACDYFIEYSADGPTSLDSTYLRVITREEEASHGK
jgi:hypothetical protein